MVVSTCEESRVPKVTSESEDITWCISVLKQDVDVPVNYKENLVKNNNCSIIIL